jgi:hypothetical protein
MSCLSWPLVPHVAWPQGQEREAEGGIGGTGIVGVLTDFGSLIVAGAMVETDESTRFTDGFGAIAEAQLNVGDSLTIEATGPREGLVARRVHVTHPLVGAVSAVSPDGRRLVVNGINVDAGSTRTTIALGQRVAVSGLWRANRVVASRIAPTSRSLDLVSGDVLRGFGATRIGGVDVRGQGVSGLTSGSFATAIGRYDPSRGRLQADRIERERFFGAAGPLGQLYIEGYLEPTSTAPGYRIAGLGHSFERNLSLEAYQDSRVLFTGPYTGKFAASRAYVLPEALAARRRVLRDLSLTAL